MKKSILFTCALLATFSLTAFGFINWNDTKTNHRESFCAKAVNSESLLVKEFVELEDADFFYDYGTRFRGVKKSTLENAKSITDFLPYKETAPVVSYYSVSVIIIKNDEQTDIRESGDDAVLTEGQMKLLRSSDYSTNFLIRAEFQGRNNHTGFIEDNYFTPHLTIVPEKEAEYIPGKEALLDYLKENNKENTLKLNKDKLQPAKLYFTVTKKGKIDKINLDRTSGYPEIDKAMIKLITNAPGKWAPAENTMGEKVDQELVISFGMIGC